MGYLQRVLMNIIRDEYRRAQRLPDAEPLTEGLVDEERSAVEQTLGLEFLAAYDRALEQLTVTQREALVMRVEFGFRFPEIAKALGKPTPNAARMVVMRALVRVAELMDEPK
jgi:RNA polymerase sigma-70 factor (ECF subfamily)